LYYFLCYFSFSIFFNYFTRGIKYDNDQLHF
jgi:hypothetical protein